MEQLLRDTAYTGAALWAAGYLASMAVYFSGLDYDFWGKVVLALYIPCAAVFAFWYFSDRTLSLQYYAGVGLAWSLIAIVLDIPFIVFRFDAWHYYSWDVYVYYTAMLLIPVAAGLYIRGQHPTEMGREGGDKPRDEAH